MDMKGMVFTTDVIIGLSLVLVIILAFVSLEFEFIFPERRYEKINYFADDIINLLSNLKVDNVKEKLTIKNLIEDGVLKEVDLNKTVLDLIGSFWYANNKTIAENISREVLEVFNETCMNMTTGGQIIYSSCDEISENIAVRAKIASGYEVGKPVSGYIARAWAISTKKNNTKVVKGDVISSSVKKPGGGNNQNDVNITYDFFVPQDAGLIYSYWFIEAYWVDNKFKGYINDVHVPGSDASGSKLLIDLNSYLHAGYNTLTVIYRFGQNGPEAGDDGASHFVLDYSTEQKETLPPRDKIYFGTVYSDCSIRYKKPIFVVGDINSLEVNLTLIATNATLRFIHEGQTYNISKKTVVNNNVYWNDTEIRNAMDSEGVPYSDLTSTYFWFIVDIDDYNSREELGSGRVIFNSSYVGINATYRVRTYGFIDMTKVAPIYSYSDSDTGDFYRDLEWRFNSSGIPLRLDSQLAWLYWFGSDPQQNITANSLVLYQHPPQPLIEEFARFGYINESGEIEKGENSYILNFTAGYSVNPFNSLVDHTFLLHSIVGYGDVFNTSDLAVADAKQRLVDLWVGEDISAEEIIVENKSIAGIRWLWGPSLFKVLVWEK